VFVAGSLGAQFLLWEVATVVAGRLLGINPFDQPDVELAKIAARRFLTADATQPTVTEQPALTDSGVEIYGSPELLAGVQDLSGAIAALLSTVSPESSGRNYLAVMAYLQRGGQAELLTIRSALAARSGRPVTFGWGPRFLHSTGQYHKGGPKTGVYLQITGAPDADLPVPGQPFSFAELLAAQAAGDAQVLSDRGRPILRLHLTHRATGLARLLEVLQ
jgi:glucose-6-phosphate isomerase